MEIVIAYNFISGILTSFIEKSQLSSEMIIAISTLITTVLAAIVSAFVSITTMRKAARKDEVQFLREEIERLQHRVAELENEKQDWQKKYDALLNESLQCKIENQKLERERNEALERIAHLEQEIASLRQKIEKKE